MKKQWLPPKYWQDFESMCHLLYVAERKPIQNYLYGRAGQAQHGVDIAMKVRNDIKWLGIQCKLKTELNSSSLSEDEILIEYKKSLGFKEGLEKLCIATTCQRDKNVQDRARKISESWQRKHPIEVLFWDDIEDLLERHPTVANLFYPDAFAPSNSLNESDDGDLSITLQARDWEEKLSLVFNHPVFIARTGECVGDVMTIASEMVDNVFNKSKGCATRVKISLSGKFLDVSDDGRVFDIINDEIDLKSEMRGLLAMRLAIERSSGKIQHSYTPADPVVSRFHKNRFEISPKESVRLDPCSASSPATHLLNRNAATKFVRDLDISVNCKEYVLRFYSANDFMNFSSASQLLSDLLFRLNGTPLRIKIGRDCVDFLPALEYAISFHEGICVDYF